MTATGDLLGGLAQIAPRYDHFILDIYGVLHDGISPFPGTIDCMTQLKKAGKQICLLSNAPQRADSTIRKLEGMGIARNLYDHIVTSGEATFLALKERGDDFHRACGQDCWFIGGGNVGTIIEGLDLNIVNGPQEASFILNCIPGLQPLAVVQLKKDLCAARDKDLPMICANPDLVVNIGPDQYECAGTFARYYEDLGGRVLYHGKPHAPIYERCRDLLGHPEKSRIIAVGDSFHTDITGAHHFGIGSIFNLTGIHWEEIALSHKPAQADLGRLAQLLARQSLKPGYVMNGLAW